LSTQRTHRQSSIDPQVLARLQSLRRQLR
jgi:hypothetical protein